MLCFEGTIAGKTITLSDASLLFPSETLVALQRSHEVAAHTDITIALLQPQSLGQSVRKLNNMESIRLLLHDVLLHQALVLVTVSLIAFLLLSPWLDHRRRRLPPGPWGLPLLGYLPFLARNHTDSVMRLIKRYGKIFCLRFGVFDVVFVADFEVLKRITRLDVFNNRPQFTIFTHLLGAALGNSESRLSLSESLE